LGLVVSLPVNSPKPIRKVYNTLWFHIVMNKKGEGIMAYLFWMFIGFVFGVIACSTLFKLFICMGFP
jgi:hypothetical protein